MEKLVTIIDSIRHTLADFWHVLVTVAERFDYIDYLFVLESLTVLIVVHLWLRNQFLGRQVAWLEQRARQPATVAAATGDASSAPGPSALELWMAVDRMDRAMREQEAALQSLMSEQTGTAQELERFRSSIGNSMQDMAALAQHASSLQSTERMVADLRAELANLRRQFEARPTVSTAQIDRAIADFRSEIASLRQQVEARPVLSTAQLERAVGEIRSEVAGLRREVETRATTPASQVDLAPIAGDMAALRQRLEATEARLLDVGKQNEHMAERVVALDNVAANMRSAIRGLKTAMPGRADGLQDLLHKLEQGYGEIQSAREHLTLLSRDSDRQKAALRETLERFVAMGREN